MMLLSAFLGGWAASPWGIANGGTDDSETTSYLRAREFFGETYGVQVFGIVFGYLCIARLNICYSRYWEGVSHLKMMHSKWSDAAAQAIAFDQVRSHAVDLSSEPFCCHLVHLFSQLSAMATMSLHVNNAGLAETTGGVHLEWLRTPQTTSRAFLRTTSMTRCTADTSASRPLGGTSAASESAELSAAALSADAIGPEVTPGVSPGSGRPLTPMVRLATAKDTAKDSAVKVYSAVRDASSDKETRRRRAEALNDTFTQEELDFCDLT